MCCISRRQGVSLDWPRRRRAGYMGPILLSSSHDCIPPNILPHQTVVVITTRRALVTCSVLDSAGAAHLAGTQDWCWPDSTPLYAAHALAYRGSCLILTTHTPFPQTFLELLHPLPLILSPASAPALARASHSRSLTFQSRSKQPPDPTPWQSTVPARRKN